MRPLTASLAPGVLAAELEDPFPDPDDPADPPAVWGWGWPTTPLLDTLDPDPDPVAPLMLARSDRVLENKTKVRLTSNTVHLVR